MTILGSSAILSLGISYSATGGTGPTGPVGPTGATGPGLTGNTGANIIGITLENRYIITTFSNGQTYGTGNQFYGETGPAVYQIAVSNIGTGISLGYGVSGPNILLRPIKFVNNTNSILTIVENPDKVEINLQNVYSGLTVAASSSTERNFIKFNSSGAVERIPNTFGVTYDNTSGSEVRSVSFVNANIFEKVRGGGWTGTTASIFCDFSNTGVTCTINPFAQEYDELSFGAKPKVFITDFYGNTGSIVINDFTDDGNVYGFDLFVRNAKNPQNLQNRFSSNIKWPGMTPPCFSVDGSTCDIKISFFGLQGNWYATAIPLSSNCLTRLFETGCSTTKIVAKSFTSSLFGACCKSDGTCEETIAANCSGFFHGVGTTCGNTFSSICDIPGVCCRKIIVDGVEYIETISDQLTCSDCLGLTGETTKFAGNYTTTTTTNCSDVFNRIGACCDGKGNCSVISYEECLARKGFYQGDSSSCFNLYGFNVCSSGTGPCCVDGNCNESNYLSCFDLNGFYLGSGQTCGSFTCPTEISCLGYINGIPITPGTSYGGGIVVGVFNPGVSKILGAKELFSPSGFTLINKGLTFTSELYTSFLDNTAYGITKDCSNINESYLIIVYPYDLAVDSLGNIRNPETEVYKDKTFIWGSTASSWGPLLDNGGNYFDVSIPEKDYRLTHLNFSEGYWSTGFTGATQAEQGNVFSNTFPTCQQSVIYGNGGIQRIFSKSPNNLHGVWYSSWGIYNTIRAISAVNAHVRKVNDSLGYYSWTEFAGFTGINAFIAARKISDGITSSTQGITGNVSYMTDWYLPSHDEFGFIAANTVSDFGFNINQVLIGNAQALNGIYWTSTGTFDYNKNEGIYTGVKPTPGSVAIAMEIDINGNIENYKTIKSNRTTKHKVRPIRAIRCDQLVSPAKLLTVPPVYSERNKNINQTIIFEQL